MTRSANPTSIPREAAIEPPAAVPTGPRIYRRPTPPPSQRQHPRSAAPQDGRSMTLPMTPRALPAPPRSESSPVEPPRQGSAAWPRVVFMLATSVGLVFFAVVWGWTRYPVSKARAADSATPDQQAVSSTATAYVDPSNYPGVTATSTTPANGYCDAALEEMLRDDPPEARETAPLRGAQLLASRFYELQADAEGRIVSARLPGDNLNRRFGPATEEVTALGELPHLKRLDLRDTIASAAIPIANRLPRLRVLVLEDQTQPGPLEKLEHVEELHLVNSKAAPRTLARRGIKVVHAERR